MNYKTFLHNLKKIYVKTKISIYKFNPLLFKSYLKGKLIITRIIAGKLVQQFDMYGYFNFRFKWTSPKWIKAHRHYFVSEARGYGEDPFHIVWFDIFTHFKPESALEIGVYRGQTISLWTLISKTLELKTEIFGISPLNNAGDALSIYPDLDYEKDIKENFAKFSLEFPRLVKALSTDFEAEEFIKSRLWDLIYIDGGHDFDVVLHDYKIALKQLNVGGILCLDDSSLYSKFKIDGIFKGHPGPSKVVHDFAEKEMRHLLTVGHNNFYIKI
jgi:hypothetical protein